MFLALLSRSVCQTAPPIPAWRQPYKFQKTIAEMALVVKATFQGDLHQGQIANHQFFGSFDAQGDQVIDRG